MVQVEVQGVEAALGTALTEYKAGAVISHADIEIESESKQNNPIAAVDNG